MRSSRVVLVLCAIAMCGLGFLLESRFRLIPEARHEQQHQHDNVQLYDRSAPRSPDNVQLSEPNTAGKQQNQDTLLDPHQAETLAGPSDRDKHLSAVEFGVAPPLSSAARSGPVRVKNFSAPEVLAHADASDLLRRAFEEETFLFDPKLILHEKSNRNHEFGVLMGISVAGGGVRSREEYGASLRKYLGEVHSSAKLLHHFRASETGMALVIDFDISEVPSTTLALFDVVIFNSFANASVESLKGQSLGWTSKVSALLYTPFEKTLYVDADSRFCADPAPIFEALRAADVLAAKEAREPDYFKLNNGINAGVIAFRTNAKAAHVIYRVMREILGTRHGDQGRWRTVLSFKSMRDVRFRLMPLRFHFQHCRLQHSACAVSGEVVLFHGRVWSGISARMCELVNRSTQTRIIQFQGKIQMRYLKRTDHHTLYTLDPEQQIDKIYSRA